MTTQMIRRFQIDGVLTEIKMWTAHSSARSLLIGMMRDDGFTPLIDVSPVFLTTYKGGDQYEFSLTMHGVFVGRDKAWETYGMMDGRLIPRKTSRNEGM